MLGIKVSLTSCINLPLIPLEGLAIRPQASTYFVPLASAYVSPSAASVLGRDFELKNDPFGAVFVRVRPRGTAFGRGSVGGELAERPRNEARAGVIVSSSN
jgi:hypothetical protein